MSNNLGLSQIAATQSNKHVTANDQAGQLDAALTEVLSVESTTPTWPPCSRRTSGATPSSTWWMR
jgi:hypothetical protein